MSSSSTKRKSSAQGEGGESYSNMDSDGQTPSSNRRGSSKQSGAPTGGEAAVTKRTLQNRKAQREFRKRREARVRDLEDRCRRFDQMGLEANVELQRVARNLKEENEALRGFVIRVGYGGMLSSILEGVGHHQSSMDNALQATFAGSFGGAGTNASKPVEEVHSLLGRSTDNGLQHSRTKAAPAPQYNFQDASNTSWMSSESQAHNSGAEKRVTDDKANYTHSPSSASSSSSSQSDLLSLNLQKADNLQKIQQSQPEFTATQDTNRSRMLPNAISPNTALNTFLNHANGSVDGHGMTGSAMLQNFNSPRAQQPNSFTPYPIPQRTHQNEALLNPNPIPFAFNLSSDAPQINATWWEQMGGGRVTPGRESTELDEKAQAVAAAQGNNGGTQSPFDLSAFLQGGMTPGGGFNLHGLVDHSQDKDKGPEAQLDSGNANETDHMRTFVQLLERKVAEREARTVASLGFQPPSQDPSQRQERSSEGSGSKLQVTPTSALSPSGVYSRLAKHPAFLSTDARELEELVDALGSEAARSPSTDAEKAGKSLQNERIAPAVKDEPASRFGGARSGSKSEDVADIKGSSPARPASSGSVEVDERAIERLMGLLDQKKIFHRGDYLSKGLDTAQPALSMAMS